MPVRSVGADICFARKGRQDSSRRTAQNPSSLRGSYWMQTQFASDRSGQYRAEASGLMFDLPEKEGRIQAAVRRRIHLLCAAATGCKLSLQKEKSFDFSKLFV